MSKQQELQEAKKVMVVRKNELVALKNSNSNSWSDKLQDELDELVSSEVDLEEQIEGVNKQLLECVEEDSYNVQAGTEDMIHLLIVHGRRFNSNTGKEESLPYIQIFSVNEFNLFKNNASLLGYSVVKVLHDPTGEANKLVTK